MKPLKNRLWLRRSVESRVFIFEQSAISVLSAVSAVQGVNTVPKRQRLPSYPGKLCYVIPSGIIKRVFLFLGKGPILGLMRTSVNVRQQPGRASTVPPPVDSVVIDDLSFYRVRAFAPYPDLVHAIFTRVGGFSQAPYRSLNLSVSVGDKPAVVRQNFERACRAVGIAPEQTVSCPLVHGARVLTVTHKNRQAVMAAADGLITRAAGIHLFMRFGDCTPLLFFDPVVKAVGLTHAGWRGTMQNAAGATVQALSDRFGCRPGRLIAVIGPAIGPCCYEVGPEVITAAEQTFTETTGLFTRRNGRQAHFDLWEANRRQLAAAGVGQIIQTGLCTACRTDQFFSHRAERGRTGRFGAVIGLREGGR